MCRVGSHVGEGMQMKLANRLGFPHPQGWRGWRRISRTSTRSLSSESDPEARFLYTNNNPTSQLIPKGPFLASTSHFSTRNGLNTSKYIFVCFVNHSYPTPLFQRNIWSFVEKFRLKVLFLPVLFRARNFLWCEFYWASFVDHLRFHNCGFKS